jgi:hypothetical protein
MIPLGSGPMPSASEELSKRLTGGVRRVLGSTAVAVEAQLRSNALIDEIGVDLTGASLSTLHGDAVGAIESATPATIARLQVVGTPVVIRQLPVTVSATAHDLPVSWKRGSDGVLWLAAEESRDGADRATASLDASVEIAAMERAVHSELERRVKNVGFTLKSLTLHVQAVGKRGLSLRADATVAKSFLSAKVTVTGRAAISDSFMLTVSEVELTSGNPIIGALVAPVNSKLHAWNGRRVDLTQYTFAGARLQSLKLTVDSSVRLQAGFGA